MEHASVAEQAIAAELADVLRQHGPMDLRDVLQRRPSLRQTLSGGALRLLPLCQLFPSLFDVLVWWVVLAATEGAAGSLRISAALSRA